MDPLSDVLSLLKPRSYRPEASMRAGNVRPVPRSITASNATPWFPAQCWLSVDGVADPVRLETGDCFLLPRGRPFRLASDLALPPVDALAMFLGAAERRHRSRYNGGGDCFIVGGHFVLDGNHADILLGMLPPIVHICKRSGQSGAALVAGADDAGAARSAAGRVSGGRATSPT